MEHIFDRFYSERPQGEKFGQHSGLGLSISRQIVEALRGRISAENRRDVCGKVDRRAVRRPAAEGVTQEFSARRRVSQLAVRREHSQYGPGPC